MSDPATVAGNVSLTAATTSFTLGVLSISEIGVIVSGVVAIISCAMHVWYTLRKDARERAEVKRLADLMAEDGRQDPPA